nr:hypothetical protein [Tanacetum cinerariifolium]
MLAVLKPERLKADRARRYKVASPTEESFVKSSKMLENQENVKSRSDKENANKMTHPYPKRRFVPQAILTKSGKLKTADYDGGFVSFGDGKGRISRKDNIVAGPKDSTVDAGKKATEVDESQVLNNGRQDDQVIRNTGIFGNAYNDEAVEEEVDMNNVMDIVKKTKSKQNQTKSSSKWKAWKSQSQQEVNLVKVEVKDRAEVE